MVKGKFVQQQRQTTSAIRRKLQRQDSDTRAKKHLSLINKQKRPLSRDLDIKYTDWDYSVAQGLKVIFFIKIIIN